MPSTATFLWGRVDPLGLPPVNFELFDKRPSLHGLSFASSSKPNHVTGKKLEEGVIRTLIYCDRGLSNMSNPPSKPLDPRLYDLQKPEKLSKILKEDKDDCLSCRLVGQFQLFSLLSHEHLANPSDRSISIHRTWGLCLLHWATGAKGAGTHNR